MDNHSLDPYEHQLFKVFEGHDTDRLGSLDRTGLLKLCETLQLEDRAADLTKALLANNEDDKKRITFIEFKDALLNLLGTMQNHDTSVGGGGLDINTSPEREVSPKFVYGSKKYGRRSRPNKEEVKSVTVQRSNSQNEVSYSKKRRTNNRLKRCTSFNDVFLTTGGVCTENMLRQAWRKLGVGEDGFLNQNELVVVCEAIGLNKLADSVIRQLSNELVLDYNKRISFEELLEVLQQDETWSEFMSDGIFNGETNGVQKNTSGIVEKDCDEQSLDDNTFLTPKKNEVDVSFVDLTTPRCNYNTPKRDFGNHLTPNNNDFENQLIRRASRDFGNSLNRQGDNGDFDNLLIPRINIRDFNNLLSPQNGDFNNISLNSSTSYHDGKLSPLIKLGVDGSGFTSADQISDQWEQAGISSPKNLLTDLGFKNRTISIQEISTVIEKEIKTLNEFRIDHTRTPLPALLQANLTLHQNEIKCLRTLLEQMQEEREKLKNDVFEANNRATLLAQEVDDNVANMELNTQKHVKLLEQRHVEILKEATQNFALEKEQMNSANQELESKLETLQSEESKTRDELSATQKYCSLIEKENQDLTLKINEFEDLKNSLQKQIDLLEVEKLRAKDCEVEQREKLIARISALQFDNTNLRDERDEMVSRIEALSNEIASLRSNSRLLAEGGVDVSVVCEGVHLGTKRRSEEPTSGQELHSLEIMGNESPRLEKVRKFQNAYSQPNQQRAFVLNDSGFDADNDSCCQSLQLDEINSLRKRVQNLERLLTENSIQIPDQSGNEDEPDEKSNTNTNKVSKSRTCKYRSVLVDLKVMLNKMENNNEYRNLNEFLSKIITEDTAGLVDELTTLKDRLKQTETERDSLTSKCDDLENGLSLLRNEYEKCEDYWQNKLDDERRLFEQEQHINTEKLNELMLKLGDFEEQYLKDCKLPTIMEDNLEKQFTDLEAEYEDFKERAQEEISLKEVENDEARLRLQENEVEINELKLKIKEDEAEISELKLQLKASESEINELKLRLQTHATNMRLREDYTDAEVQAELERRLSCCDAEVQADCERKPTLSNHVIESTNFYSADAMPFSWNQTSVFADRDERDGFAELKEKSFSLFTLPSTSESSSVNNNNVWEQSKTMPYRHKRTRQHEKVLTQHRLPKKNNEKLNKSASGEVEFNYPEVVDKNDEQKCLVPIVMLQNLHAKKSHLEQRCKKLQYILKQQHQYDEQLLHCSWQQHRNERSELQYYIKFYHDKFEQQLQINTEQQERLAKNDSLVKDLYVDNSYLLAKNQRLEQQYQMLTSNLNTNSV